jgi:alpha-beta hydrolase superfamily lysophospholipase
LIRRQDRFQGAGGLGIFWQCWLPEDAPASVVVIAHGASEHSDRYTHVAERLVRANHAVYALDHRGHGRSEGSRALIDRIEHAVADLDALVLRARSEHPGVPFHLLGHSMGGAIALSSAIRDQERLAGLILSGPLAALEAASPGQRVVARVLSALAPRLPLFEIDASKVSRDPAVVRAYEQDPLVHHGKLPVRTVAELAEAVESFPEGVRAIAVPTLIMYGTADELVPPEGSVMLYERIPALDRTLTPYEGLAHEIFNEPEQERVLDDLVAWLAMRSPGPVTPAAGPPQAGTR